MTARRWSALLAPLGEPTTDGRVLSPIGRWRLARRNGVPLLRHPGGEGHDDPLYVGRVLALTATDRTLTASGIVTDTDTITLMRTGRVWPQLEFGAVDLISHCRGDRLIVDRGTITAVHVGRSPAWPTVAFTLEER